MKKLTWLLYLFSGLLPLQVFAQTTADSAATPPPEPDFWHQEELTGNWGGGRTWLKNKGIETEFKLTQFYQALVSGGIEEGSEYNGKFQTVLKFDLEKLAGWKFWMVDFRTETRFGGPLLGGVGAINPVNTAVILPGAKGTVFSITALNVTKAFPVDLKEGKLIAISAGRFNLLDLLQEDFFAGGGTEKFFNIAQIGPLTVVRQVPLITNSASFAYIRKGEPFLTFTVLDPNDHSTDAGLSDLFADGVSFGPAINVSAKHFGKKAKHSFGGFITTKEYTPFDEIRQVLIPGPPLHPLEKQGGSWSVNYTFRQYFVERGKKDGWGLFTQVSFADKATSPIDRFATIGIGGNGLFKNRAHDEFGLAYSYTNLSSDLKDNIELLSHGGKLLAEHQAELFYNLHLTPWFRLTGDLQYVRPTRPIADPAIIPGGRLQIRF